MAHHKRKGPKSRRAGCLHCKPHKHERVKSSWSAQRLQERRARQTTQEFLRGMDGEST